jgi:LAS superfamily LD-carboxypeptidase LdcB
MKDKKIKSVADVDPAKLAYYIGQKLGAPGYSNHQSARAIDLMQWVADPNSQSGKTKIGKDGWEGSELHQWLIRNAEKYDFYPISGEPWHWEYKPQTN